MSERSIPDPRAEALRHGRVLEWVTIGWNSLEALIALACGVAAGSISLLGFGADSLIERGAGIALLWRLRAENDDTCAARERSERIARQAVGVSFLLLGCYVGIDAVRSLVEHRNPERRIAGIAIAAAALVVMPILARAKRRVALQLQSEALRRESRQSDFCAWLAAIVLVGLLSSSLLGWWWADPVAALLMVPIIAREGVQTLRGESCGCHVPSEIRNAEDGR
jgi:divalent metal cation (Fe/Co/Zn/Cd) transporter